MKTILVVNGESYWQDYLPEFKIVQKKLQTTEWLLKNNELYAVDADGSVKPDGILWRVGAIKPEVKHQEVLNLIALSKIPCLNSAKVLQMGYDRLSMLSVLRESTFPVITFDVVTNNYHLKNLERDFPIVVKVGNYHGGFGKVLIENERSWQDLKDLLFISNDYVTVEPFINYDLDIRYLAIGEKVWAMARRGKYWKSNVETTDFTMIEKDNKLTQSVLELQSHLQSDILAVDILQEKNGNKYVIEYNDVPGLSGFPNKVQIELAERLKSKIF
jgi:ribosomal protein S6--L-glutamate ligase